MKNYVKVLITIMAIIMLFSGMTDANSSYARPAFKMFIGSGGSQSSLSNAMLVQNHFYVRNPEFYNSFVENQYFANTYYDNKPDYDFHGQLGYNFDGPLYFNIGMFYETEDRSGPSTRITSLPVYVENYIKLESFIPYFLIEYTNRLWKINYYSGIGFAYLRSRADVYNGGGFDISGESIGTYELNTPGIIFSGGIGYELYNHVSLNFRGGYRHFSGDKLDPIENEYVPIDLDYSGAFFGIGLGYGIGIR